MNERELLAERFEANRSHLRSVAYRMLGSASEADDAVQEAWLRLSRTDAGRIEAIDNLAGWLTTVVSRLCLDMLRARRSRGEQPLTTAGDGGSSDPGLEQEAAWVDSVGIALLTVLDALAPAERVAFVLHDLFSVPFDTIAPIVDRSTVATRQLASRARRRVQNAGTIDESELRAQQQVIDAFLTAARNGDVAGLVAVLDPQVVLRNDPVSARGGPLELHGAAALADRVAKTGARTALRGFIDGVAGVLVAPDGQIQIVLRITIEHGRIVEIDAIGEPERIAALELVKLD